MSTQAATPPAGTSAREEFGAREITHAAETASTAVAAQAKASIEARYIVAMQRPRDIDDVRIRLLNECKRPGFAKAARYRKPVGKGVEGPSIRFAEAAIRYMGNISVEVMALYDAPEKRLVRVTVADLEANSAYYKDAVIDKTVERSNLKDGQAPISMRQNSYGKTTYLVAATEDDMLAKEGALVSKAIRTLGLRLVPGDIVEECMERCKATVRDEAAKDPEAARKAIADAFAELRIMPSDLKVYLGHDLGTASPAEIQELRDVYSAVRDGEAKWQDIVASKLGDEGKPAEPGASATTKIADKVTAAKAGREPGSDDGQSTLPTQ